jgi:hypothetical protein
MATSRAGFLRRGHGSIRNLIPLDEVIFFMIKNKIIRQRPTKIEVNTIFDLLPVVGSPIGVNTF